MKVACIMMEKNENLLLNNWIHYHGALFGYENLYIFDNGSESDEVRRELEQLGSKHGLSIDYSRAAKADYEGRGDLFIRKIRELESLSDYDFFIPLDCDEFLCVQRGEEVAFSRQSIFEALGKHRGSPDALKIEGCYYNSYGRRDYYYYLDVPKTFFAAGAAGYLDQGFHDGRSRLSPHSAPTAMRMMHLHNKPFQTLKAHAAMKLQGRVKSMEPIDLKAYRGPGQHLIRYFFMAEEDYVHSFPWDSALHIPAFAEAMDGMGAPLPF